MKQFFKWLNQEFANEKLFILNLDSQIMWHILVLWNKSL